jgi:hypothetical protein
MLVVSILSSNRLHWPPAMFTQANGRSLTNTVDRTSNSQATAEHYSVTKLRYLQHHTSGSKFQTATTKTPKPSSPAVPSNMSNAPAQPTTTSMSWLAKGSKTCPLLTTVVIDPLINSVSSGFRICMPERLQEPYYSWLWIVEYAMWLALLVGVVIVADVYYRRAVGNTRRRGSEETELRTMLAEN